VALALAAEPGGRQHPAGRLDLDVRALVRPDRGALDVARQADAHLAAFLAAPVAESLELVPAGECLELAE
jgi:hypothetical protein